MYQDDPGLEQRLSRFEAQLDRFSLALHQWQTHEHAPSGTDIDHRIRALEETIDRFETELTPLRQFILAGGGSAGAMLHVARTVCRRAERRVVALAETVEIDPLTIEYLNRLSDFLFVMARLVNQRHGQQEIAW